MHRYRPHDEFIVDYPACPDGRVCVGRLRSHDRPAEPALSARAPCASVQCASALNVQEVAQKLGVHPEIVRSMARKGHLKRLASKNARAPLLVSPGEVDRFNNAYVTGGALARSLNVNATNLLKS